MKRIIFLVVLTIIIIASQLSINCSKPLDSNSIIKNPDPEPNTRDTVYLFDTIINIDTVISIDTLFGSDTTFIYDTVIIGDTIFDGDTIFIVDTIFGEDTIIIYDTIVVGDTIFSGDTIFIFDTIIIVDTLLDTDTINITDTFVDTVIDSIIQIDTLIIVDTLTISPTYCASLSASQKRITWMLQNHAGIYHLEFIANGDNNDPKQLLIIEVNGEEFEWYPYNDSEISFNIDLTENSTAIINPTTPRAFGHAIDICLKVEKE